MNVWEWMTDHPMVTALVVVVVGLALVLVLVGGLVNTINTQRHEQCAQMISLAHTAHDSLLVVAKCGAIR